MNENKTISPVGISVATGVVDGGIAAAVAYAVMGKFSWPIFLGVGVVATGVALCALSFAAVAKEADELALC